MTLGVCCSTYICKLLCLLVGLFPWSINTDIFLTYFYLFWLQVYFLWIGTAILFFGSCSCCIEYYFPSFIFSLWIYFSVKCFSCVMHINGFFFLIHFAFWLENWNHSHWELSLIVTSYSSHCLIFMLLTPVLFLLLNCLPSLVSILLGLLLY